MARTSFIVIQQHFNKVNTYFSDLFWRTVRTVAQGLPFEHVHSILFSVLEVLLIQETEDDLSEIVLEPPTVDVEDCLLFPMKDPLIITVERLSWLLSTEEELIQFLSTDDDKLLQ